MDVGNFIFFEDDFDKEEADDVDDEHSISAWLLDDTSFSSDWFEEFDAAADADEDDADDDSEELDSGGVE